MSAVLDSALELAAAGIPVFPCRPDKKPYTPHGFKDASTTSEQVKAWWTKYPEAMIGMPTGAASGFWVLDVDAAKNGKEPDGYNSLAELTVKHGQLPLTRAHMTGGGGIHYLFRYPQDGRRIGNSAKRLPPKIDIRGEGGYIIMPPSVNAGGHHYVVKDESPATDAPEWLLNLVLSPSAPERDTPEEHSHSQHDSSVLHPYVQAAVSKELAKLVSAIPGTRNDILNKVAFALGQWVAGNELPESEARINLFQAAQSCGLEESETHKTIESGLSAGMQKPRYAPLPSRESPDDTPFIYKVYSGTDILTLPRPEWRVKEVLPETGMAAIFGPSRAGKSFLALDLALAITSGLDWFGWKTIPCPVLYVNLESSWGLPGRLKAWISERGHALPGDLNFIIDAFNLLNPKHVEAIIQAAPENGVVIIDTLNRATPGADENASKDMGNIIKSATDIQAATGGLVLFVTHSGKNPKSGIRGHSSLLAALDAAIEVDHKGGAHVLKLDKVKEGEDGVRQDFQLKTVVIESSPENNMVTSCVVEPVVRQEKEKFLTPALKYALDSLVEACETIGEEGVHQEIWRATFYAGHTGETTEAKRKAFTRGRNKLVALGIVSVHDDMYTRTTGLVPDKADLS